jgi:hypothetical protein
MKRFAYFRNEGGSYGVHPFDAGEAISSTDDVSAVMMERPEVDIKVVKLPSIREDEVQTMLRYKLRSLYPGNPEDTAFDFRIVANRNQKYAVLFITSKAVLENYRRASGGRPLFLPYSFVKQLSKSLSKPRALFLFVQERWVEALLFEEGIINSSSVVKRGDDLPLVLSKANALLPERGGDAARTIICSQSEIQAVEKVMNGIHDDGARFDYLDLETVFGENGRNVDYLFGAKRGNGILQSKWTVALLLMVALSLSALALHKYKSVYELRYEELSEQVEDLQNRQLETLALKEEVRRLEEQWASLSHRAPNDVYQILSELATVFDGDMKITHFVIDRDMFQIEAIGRNPLYLMERFKTNGHFRSVKLIQSIPINQTFNERFRITGYAKIE